MVAATGRNHRIAILIGIGRHIHDDGFIGRHRFFQDGIEIADFLDPQSHRSIGVRKLDEIRRRIQITRGVAPFVEQILPLADHAVKSIVEDNNLHRQLAHHSRGHFLHVHLNAAVSRNAQDQAIPERRLRTHGSGKSKPHRAKSA